MLEHKSVINAIKTLILLTNNFAQGYMKTFAVTL